MDTSHEALAQREAELHLEQCYESAEEYESGTVEWDNGFCGCTTCIVREVLTAATPHLYRALLELLHDHGVGVPADVEKLFAD